jgi:hypothetical protein
MNRDDALKKSDEALQELAQSLKQGKSHTLVRYLEMLSKFHRYSFCNCMLITLQNPYATHVAGFHRWKSLGRFVKKGEAGIAILAPLLFRGKKKEVKDAEDGAEPTERLAPTIRGFRVVHVFDVAQTEGKELTEFATLGGDPGENIDRLEAIIRSHGIAFEFVDSLGGANGMSEGGRIQVVRSLPNAQKFSTMTHELAHELLHRGDRRSQLELIRDVATRILTELDADQVKNESEAAEEVTHVA